MTKGDGVAHWEMVVRHDEPEHPMPLETCGRLVVAGNIRLTQPARTVRRLRRGTADRVL